ncbi:MAG: GNAT family N-acetyltransferase [Pseudomonadota bacterium]
MTAAYFDALDATWPAAEMFDLDGWRLRRGAGGGKRVSAATSLAPGADPSLAVEAMERMGQTPLFQLRDDETDLDAELAARGFEIVDPVLIYEVDIAELTHDDPEIAKVFRAAGPAALLEEIWAAGGIGPERLAVMNRAAGPKVWLCARLGDRPGGVAFCAVAGEIAMIHAIEVIPAQRRQGAARRLITGAANFAADNGASKLALAVTRANAPANALYQSLGMTAAAKYHYRIRPDGA